MIQGIDVSKYQGVIDWHAVAPKIGFAFVRSTMDEALVDPKLDRNRKALADAGMIRGYYHFAHPEKPAAVQAKHACDTLGPLSAGELDLVLDLEWTHRGETPASWSPDDTKLMQAWTREFVAAVQSACPGRNVVIYTRFNFWSQYLGGMAPPAGCPLWIAEYRQTSTPPADPTTWEAWALARPPKSSAPWPAWAFWQFSSKALLPGIGGGVDANLFQGTMDDLRRLAHLAPEAPVRGPTADALCRLMLSQAGDPYVFGYEVRLDDPNPSAFDCSEILEWAAAQLHITPKMPDGSWSQATHIRDHGLLLPVDTAIGTRGAVLFKFSSSPFEGTRPSTAHVAVSLGDGRTIEARPGGVGVYPAIGRGFTHAGRVPGLDYSGNPQGGAIDRGDKGPEVRAWQLHLLAFRPTILPKFGADGDFGAETEEATKTFQSAMGLPPTGIVGPETREAMQRVLSMSPSGTPRTPRGTPSDGMHDVHMEALEPGRKAPLVHTFSLGGFAITVRLSPEGLEKLGSLPPGVRALEAGEPRPSDADESALPLPPRRADAPGGKALFERAGKLSLAAREALFHDQILAGNVPSFARAWWPVRVTAPGGALVGVILVTPDYLAVGSDEDFVRVPLTPITAQRIADDLGCLLPTKKIAMDVFAAGRAQVAIPRSHDREAPATFVRHDADIEAARKTRGDPLGSLLTGHKKDIVVTNRLCHCAHKLAIFGFYQANRKPWQDLNTKSRLPLAHYDLYVDYSHGVRLVHGLMRVGTARMRVAEVLRDPALASLVSEEGVIFAPRYEIHPIG
ncbi:MAG: GH25 family lysozyme [Polyangiaceae bacterium]